MSIVGGKEIYEKISPLIEQQFPEYIREEGPKFVAFVKAYYEFMETSGQAVREARKLYDTLDIDRTEDDYLEYFHRNFMDNIPRSVLADKRLLAKHIREFYRARGSQESCRFLFRALFDEEIEFYYPEEDILRASDGRWVREVVIRGIPQNGNAMLLSGKQVTGSASGATARISQILRISSAGLDIFELTAENVIGEFAENELVSDGFGNSLRVFSAVGSIFEVNVVDGGAYHFAGDKISLTGLNGGSALGEVTGTTDISAVTFRIQSGGAGYRIPTTTVTLSGGSPKTPAQIAIKNLSNTSFVLLSDSISSVSTVILGSLPFGQGKPKMATSDINTTIEAALTFENVATGSVNTISLINPGSGYTGQLPVVVLQDFEISQLQIPDTEFGGFLGENAVVVAERAPGSITTISITSSDASFLKNDTITVTNLTRDPAPKTDLRLDTSGNIDVNRGLFRNNVYDAAVTGDILGTFTLSGRYIDTKGFLSWNNRLQDNDFYQAFSYVISSRKLIREYKKTLDLLTHPAGFKMFGFLRNETTASMYDILANPEIVLTEAGDTLTHEDETDVTLETLLGIGSSITVYEKAPNTFNVITFSDKTLRASGADLWWANGTLKINSGSEPGSNLMIVFPDVSQLELIPEGNHSLLTEDTTPTKLLHEDDSAIAFEPTEPFEDKFVYESGDTMVQDVEILSIPVRFANGLYTVNTISSDSILTLRSAIELNDVFPMLLLTEEKDVITDENGNDIILDPGADHYENSNGIFYYFKSRTGTI